VTAETGNGPAQPLSKKEAAVNEVERLEAAVGECREMIREAHAATKDLRAAVREAKRELQDLAKDEVSARIQGEVFRQLEELGERTQEAVSAATQKVIAEFDRFGESLLGKETYWQTASGRRAVTRPDPDVVTLDVQPGDDKA
jgi:chromosome segregation ATPase